MNVVIMNALKNMLVEVESIIDSNLDFEDTYHAITAMKLKQLERYSATFNQNLMVQYSESPDFF